MSGAKTAQALGKEIERDFQGMLLELSQKFPLAYERLYDTHSAGSFLPPMPSDFIIGYAGVTHFVELKSSANYSSLSDGGALRNLVKNKQVAKMRMWIRAKSPCSFIFVNQTDGHVEWWQGKDVVSAFLIPKGKLIPDPPFRFPSIKEMTPAFTKALTSIARDI